MDAEQAAHKIHWSLSMTLAWIMWRSLDKVALLQDFSNKKLFFPEETSSDADKPELSFFEAEVSLLLALMRGRLAATATSGEKLVEIAKENWCDLVWRGENALYAKNNIIAGPQYKNPIFLSTDVTRLWPVPPAWSWQSSDDYSTLLPQEKDWEKGFIEVVKVACWLSAEQGASPFDVHRADSQARWKKSYDAIISAVADGRVDAYGETPDGRKKQIPSIEFYNLIPILPFTEPPFEWFISDDECRLVNFLMPPCYVGAGEDWRTRFGDTIGNRFASRYSDVVLSTAKVLKVWPRPDGKSPVTHSGGAGRPKSLPLTIIEQEFDRWLVNGTKLTTQSNDAETLRNWFREHHPSHYLPSIKTIVIKIKDKHNRRKAEEFQASKK